MHDFRIEPGTSHETLCECCGQQSRTVSGFVYEGDDAAAVYFIQWTVGGVDTHGANFELIIGRWGDRSRSILGCDRVSPHGPRAVVHGDRCIVTSRRPE